MTDLRTLDYPRHVHRPSEPGAWVYRRVENVTDCAAALSEGWELLPRSLPAAPPEAPTAAVAPEATSPPVTPPRAVEMVPKRGPGRPRKWGA